MIKSELIANLSAEFTQLPEKQVVNCVNKMMELMTSALMEGMRIEVRGFGSFTCHYHPPRKAHNPKTGEEVITEGKYVPHFKPGKELRERVDASKANMPLQRG